MAAVMPVATKKNDAKGFISRASNSIQSDLEQMEHPVPKPSQTFSLRPVRYPG